MDQRDGESIEQCFRRILSLTDRKKAIHLTAGAAVEDRQLGESFLSTWQAMQDGVFQR